MELHSLHVTINLYTKMALAAYSTEYDSVNMLSTHQLEIVRKTIAVLEPIEK